jgi:SAM-dependent methyltransferase
MRDMDSSAIVPYGRSFDEYCLMFSLGDQDAGKRIVGIGDGPSDFNAVATARGWQVTSVDPLYCHTPGQIAERCQSTVDAMVAAVSLVPTHWTWTYHATAADLRSHRLATSERFLSDFAADRVRGRYIAAALPSLPFKSDSFDLALCSHLLFSWSGVLDLAFHRAALAEMLRVAREVRIFPTSKNLAVVRSRYADVLKEECEAVGNAVRIDALAGYSSRSGAERFVIAPHLAPATAGRLS